MEKLVCCPFCKGDVHVNATTCKHCGKVFDPHEMRRQEIDNRYLIWIPIIVIMIIKGCAGVCR